RRLGDGSARRRRWGTVSAGAARRRGWTRILGRSIRSIEQRDEAVRGVDQRLPRSRRRGIAFGKRRDPLLAPPVDVASQLAHRRLDRKVHARRIQRDEVPGLLLGAGSNVGPRVALALGELQQIQLGEARVGPRALLALRVVDVELGAELGGFPALLL